MRELPKRVEVLSARGDQSVGVVLINGVPFPFDTVKDGPIARVDYPPEHYPILWMPIVLDIDATVEYRRVGVEMVRQWLEERGSR